MDNRKVLKLDMLFKIFGISVTKHEVVGVINDPTTTEGCYAFSQYRKDIMIEILKKREEWFNPTPWDMNEIFEEVVHILEHIDNYDMFYISSERWATLANRRLFAHKLEYRANMFLRKCKYLSDFNSFVIEEYDGYCNCAHLIRIYMNNGRVLQYSMDNKALGEGYYGRLVFILLHLFEDALKVQEEIDKERQQVIIKIQLNSFYGLSADIDGDACVVMQRGGRGYGKSMLQLMELNKLLKNGVPKIQIAPGKKLEKLHNDILDSYRYLYDFKAIKDCTAAMVQYCKADADANMRAYLAMKENNKQVVLEQLEEVDPQVPIKQFESLVTVSSNGEPEILINVNKEDKNMMIPVVRRPEIKEVIFNEPATIVFWKDGTKTVVKCGKGEKFDPEKGVAIALAKKMLYSKDYSRVIASSDEWKKTKEAKKKTEAKKAAAKKKPMPKLPVNANVTKTSTVKKTTKAATTKSVKAKETHFFH